jgi:hypothetical protein
MTTFTRASVAQILSFGPATVKFTKLDGTERIMRCTIAEHMIPEDKRPTGKMLTEIVSNNETLRVFDLDVGDWRSFRISSIKELSVVQNSENGEQVLLG